MLWPERNFWVERRNQSGLQEALSHCVSHPIVANGKNKGVQRFCCKECGKNFCENKDTSIAHLKKAHLWKLYIRHMFEGHNIAKCANLTGISVQTAFDWRHKVLSSLQTQCPVRFEGISESDDIFLITMRKAPGTCIGKRGGHGIRQGIADDKMVVLLTCDRNKNKGLRVAKRGRIRKSNIEKILSGRLDKSSALCTDSHKSFTTFAKAEGIQHQKIHARKKQYVKD
ncbi:MAG TPA: IS1595 family transposase [Bacteroidales bacterium]|nr:IS1595 family transposase [Bacteroidales bacterium]